MLAHALLGRCRRKRGHSRVDHGTRSRVILVGGDARLLRGLRLFLDALGVFEPVAVATAGAGLNALLRQSWAAAIVVDLVYHPLETPWLAALRSRGVDASNGVGMLVGQAALAFHRWTLLDATDEAMSAAALAAIRA